MCPQQPGDPSAAPDAPRNEACDSARADLAQMRARDRGALPPDATRSRILLEVSRERDRQEVIWDGKSIASVSDPFRCVTILAEEVGEVASAAEQSKRESYREELVQVAAVAVAMLEAYDRGVILWHAPRRT